ncbi:hypothetical protein [Rhizobium leguminosarum]|uniref:hypothetical protein n=1 Tax=Rhizobium leguminosarum TaxID=384 RepID=UPI0013C24A60|nr:hypothetical protein [Rhizobium leguminosarum]NEJ46578.1 hypothetical protein [Rhizobium leguminosarum]NEJ53683.1 hypothetical protein [Rhizobium leguminosarum]
MDIAKAIIIVGIIWAALFAYLFRYEVLVKPGTFDVVRHDRWTGGVESCNVGTCLPYDTSL